MFLLCQKHGKRRICLSRIAKILPYLTNVAIENLPRDRNRGCEIFRIARGFADLIESLARFAFAKKNVSERPLNFGIIRRQFERSSQRLFRAGRVAYTLARLAHDEP